MSVEADVSRVRGMSLLVNAEHVLDRQGRQAHHRSHQLMTVAAGELLTKYDQQDNRLDD